MCEASEAVGGEDDGTELFEVGGDCGCCSSVSGGVSGGEA